MTPNEIITKAVELENSIANVNKALKRIASVKCRLNHAPGKATYQADMAACLEEERLLKAVRDYLTEPRKTVNDLTEADIASMDYIETCKAIRSIQSKKTHTKWAEDCDKDENGLFVPGTGAMYQEACRIEELLKAHRNELQPEHDKRINLKALREFLSTMRSSDSINNMSGIDVLDSIDAFLEGGES